MTMIVESEEVKGYIQKLSEKPNQNWQTEVVQSLRQLVFKTIPSVEERLQYGKPHYLKNGHYAAVMVLSFLVCLLVGFSTVHFTFYFG